MIRCQACGTENFDHSQYCDECGARLKATAYQPPNSQFPDSPVFQSANVTSIGISPFLEEQHTADQDIEESVQSKREGVHASLLIERGKSVGTEFLLTADETYIGRWDADNGIFPDVDLDTHDAEAKVSRRHARIMFEKGIYTIEDLGSTNGTYINRGRRLIPGNPQRLKDGDEVIVGKTFLRFRVL